MVGKSLVEGEMHAHETVGNTRECGKDCKKPDVEYQEKRNLAIPSSTRVGFMLLFYESTVVRENYYFFHW